MLPDVKVGKVSAVVCDRGSHGNDNRKEQRTRALNMHVRSLISYRFYLIHAKTQTRIETWTLRAASLTIRHRL